jgi:hypothetical protein
MSGWQPQDYDPRQQRPATPPQWGRQQYEQPTQQVAPYGQPQAAYQPRQPERYERPQQPQRYAPAPRKTGLTAAGKFWYILGCIPFGAMYFAKIPSKRALADFGMAEMTGAESFWYVLMCIPFGAGYFAKIPTAKALSELPQFRQAARPEVEYRR